MQNGIEISIDTGTPGSLGLTVQQVSAGTAATLATTQIALAPASSPLAPASVFASDAWLATWPRDADGYTIFPAPAAGSTGSPQATNIAYVGTQAGDFASFKPAQAFVTAAMGKNGGAGAVYFRRGQTYAPAAIDNNIDAQGPSPSQPFFVGSVGSLSLPRPIIQAGLGLANPKNVVVFGLDFYDPLADPGVTSKTTGSLYQAALTMINSGAGGQNVWVEDVRVRFMQSGLEFQQAGNLTAPFQTIIVRRCQLDHNFGQKYGLYAYYVRDLLVQDCFLDNNGWNPSVCPKTITAHNAYLQEWPTSDKSDPQTRVHNTIFARASATGIEQRSGGLNDGCCFIGNPIAMNISEHPSTFSNATIMGSGFDLSIGTGNARGDGAASVITPAATFNNVLCLDKVDSVNTGWAFNVQCDSTGTAPSVATAMTFQNVIVAQNWTGQAVTIDTPPSPTIQYLNCDLDTGKVNYVNPNVTLAAYAAVIGAAKVDASPVVKDAATFLAAAALNRRGAYDSRLSAAAVNNYLFAGFTAY